MIPVFDLDDTLYDELTYVHSGLRAVAAWGEEQLGWPADGSYDTMAHLLVTEGRGRIFNQWLSGRASAREAVRVYRHHTPQIQLWSAAARALDALQDHALYMVTDGHKGVQARKIAALAIDPRFRHAYITHRYGFAHAKPSPHCFSLIRQRERCEWSDMIYVGDNPAKDFVALNTLGMKTVRVLTGQHRDVVAKPGFDARYRIQDLDELFPLLTSLFP
jgi:putative hydrolase of the HAD superfamily